MAAPLLFIVRRVDWVDSHEMLLTHWAIFLMLLGLGPAFYLFLGFLFGSQELRVLGQMTAKVIRRMD
jgi:hypothetical protein